MPKRQPGYVTRLVARLMRDTSSVVQDDLAAACHVDRSMISHWLSGRYALPADLLEAFCDFLDSVAPLEAIARRLGYRLVPDERQAAEVTIQRASWRLMSMVGAFGATLGDALEDGHLDPTERAALRRELEEVRRTVVDLIAKLPDP